MFRMTNPHPQGKRVKDCVKRACCLASQINYHDIAIMLNRFREVSKTSAFNDKKNSKMFIEKVLMGKDNGNMQFAHNGHRFLVRTYAKYCVRPCIIQVAGHLVCGNGKGDYLDTWDCGEKSIYKVWTLPDYETIIRHIKNDYPKLCKGLTLEKQN